MKKLLFLMLVLISVSLMAQVQVRDTIKIELSVLMKVNGIPQTQLIQTSKIVEDSVYVIPQSTLQPPFHPYQWYYDGLVGGKFWIENGALDSNITVRILMNVPQTVPMIWGGQKVWFVGDVHVEGYENSTYYFLRDKAGVFEFPKTQKFLKVLDSLGYQPNSVLRFGYYNLITGGWSSIDLTTIDEPTKVTAKARHFSIIGAGDEKLVPNSVKEEYTANVPESFTLAQNYPNPFNPSTVIEYSLPKSSNVTLKVYNIIGNEVATLVDGFKQAGTYKINFNAYDLPSGTYIYKLHYNDQTISKKMILIK